MAAIHKFGFEGGYVPSGVIIDGSYMIATGRSDTTSKAVSGIGSIETFIISDTPNDGELYVTSHLKIVTFGGGQYTTLLKFGSIEIKYAALNNEIAFFVDGSIVKQQTFSIPFNAFLPVGYHVKLHKTSGSIEMIVEGSSISVTGIDTLGTTTSIPTTLSLGIGAVNGVQSQFVLDDVAINNNFQASNSSGSFGLDDVGYPAYIRGVQTQFVSTGSTFQWSINDSYATSSIIDVVNGNAPSLYLFTGRYDRKAQFKLAPISTDQVVSFEGVNVYVADAVTMDSPTNVYFETYFKSGSVTFNRKDNDVITSFPKVAAYSVYERDAGGKLAVSDLNDSNFEIVVRRFVNQNYFGQEEFSDLIVSGTYTVDPVTETEVDYGYAVLECRNLVVTSGSLLTTSSPCRALIVYVRDNLVIDGTVSMVGKGTGSVGLQPFVLLKNTSSLFDYTSASFAAGSTLSVERANQPYSPVYTTDFGLSTTFAPNTSGIVGGGGDGGSSSLGTLGTTGTSSSYWSGGTGGNGAGDHAGSGSLTPGGSIYLIVGGNAVVGTSGLVTSNGVAGDNATSASCGGGGGSGAGSVNVLYGGNFYNLGAMTATGGSGGLGMDGGQDGFSGGDGFIRIAKLLSN